MSSATPNTELSASLVIARIQDDHVVLDLRTVLPEQDEILAAL